MPQATPKRAGRQAKPGSRFPSEILADNVRTWRNVRRLSQARLARRMASLGHPWTESIVGFVERGERHVTADEFIGLHFALELDHFGALFDPLGLEGEMRPYGPHDNVDAPSLDIGGPKPLRAEYVSKWRHGQLTARGVWTEDQLEWVFGGGVEMGPLTPSQRIAEGLEPEPEPEP